MKIKKEILKMYQEIARYSGDFGDPIVMTINFNPIELIMQSTLEDEDKTGALIALLVLFTTAIDNGTYEDALSSKSGIDIRTVLEKKLCTELTFLQAAFEQSQISEETYLTALQNVYQEIVLPKLHSSKVI